MELWTYSVEHVAPVSASKYSFVIRSVGHIWGKYDGIVVTTIETDRQSLKLIFQNGQSILDSVCLYLNKCCLHHNIIHKFCSYNCSFI